MMGDGWYEFLTKTERINWKIVSLERLMMQAEVITELGRYGIFIFGFENHKTFLIFQYYQICCDNLVARRILMESHLCYHLCQSCESWLISCNSHDDIINYSLSNCTPAKKGQRLMLMSKGSF